MDPLLLLAMVMQGEAGVVPDAMPLIGHAVMNRLDDPRWSTIEEVIEAPHQWNGRAEPSSLALYWARQVLRRNGDPTGGVVVVLSEDDRETLNCGLGDVVYVNRSWSVHGYKEWCQQ